MGVSEDRVTGALDIERALTRGEKAFEAGASGPRETGATCILMRSTCWKTTLSICCWTWRNRARTWSSARGCPSATPRVFVLVGSGNPEEGELRPQLLDRFGLSVEVTSPKEIETRIEVIRRRDAYENDHAAFIAEWQPEDAALRERILAARAALPALQTSNVVLHDVASVCLALGSDGLRGELTLLRAARALAAYEGASEFTRDHIRRAAPMALRHRLRRDPLDDAGSTARVARQLAEVLP